MASLVDYSKFDKIGEEEEQAEQLAKESDRQVREQERKLAGLTTKDKFVDEDGDTVSAPSEDESSDDEDEEELHPLFWTKMPKPGSKGDQYAQVLKDMVYKTVDDEDKTPNELAQDFKEKGNDFFKWGDKYFKRALKEYKEALQWARKGDGSDENRSCYAAILSNRAAINLKFRNYGSVIRDVEAAIEFGPNPLPNCKPHYRAAFASYELGKTRQASNFIQKGLEIDTGNKTLLELKAKVEKRLQVERKEKLEKERELLKERKLDEIMRKACLQWKITMGPLVNDIELYISNSVGNKTRGGFPRPVITEDSMQWAVMFMFPETMQTDFIQSFDLFHRFVDHLDMMFPANRHECADSPKRAPWDTECAYTLDSLEVYFEEREVESYDMTKMWETQYGKRAEKEDYSKKLRVKVGLEKTLLEAISDRSFVVAGVPTFYVVSTRSKYYKDTFLPQHEGRFRIL